MKRLLFIGLIFCSTLGFTQTRLDSLKAKLSESLEDTSRVNLLIDLGKETIDFDVALTKEYAIEANELAKKINFSKGSMMALNILGNCSQRNGNLDSAMQLYDEVEKIALATNNNKGMAIVLSNKGIIYIDRGEYIKALEIILKAVDYEKIVGDKRGIAEGYLNVGVVHYYMGDLENTLEYFKRSTDLTKEVGDLRVLKKGYINIGAIHHHKEEYEEALDYYQRGYYIAEELNDQTDLSVTLRNMAQIYVKKEEFGKAEENYKKSLTIAERFKNPKAMCHDYTNLGNLFKEKGGNHQKAKDYFMKSIELAEEGGYLKELEQAYNDLAELYSDNKQFEQAFESIQEYVQLKDSLDNENNSKTFAELRTKYETAEKEKALAEEQIKSESFAKAAAEAKLTAANRNKWIIVLVAIVAGVILFFMLLKQRNKRKAQAEKDAAIIEEQDKGTKAVFLAQEEERKRISKDLHDGVGQQLSGLKMAFQKVSQSIKQENPERSNELEVLSGILTESADEVRSISHQMMPRALTELGLVEAVEDMLEKSLGLSGMSYEFEHFGINERLSENIEISLYRVCQELINNIIKHSEAQKVNVQLFKNQKKIIMIVEDDGKGMQSEKAEGHGLLNMKSRINTLNGELNLEPSPTSGTLATIRIPLL